MSRRQSTKARRVLIFVAALLPAALSPALLRADLFGVRSQRLQDGWDSVIQGFAFDDDLMGQSVAAGDFNGDGRADLAVGDYESITNQHEGAVHVIYSDVNGLSGTDQLWKDFDAATGNNDRELEDTFGYALAAGDFNNDGYDDLAIGIPGEDIGAANDAGMVMVIYGSFFGLAPAGNPGAWRWRLGADGIGGTATTGDQLGRALAVGDFDNDGKDDLAVGCPLCNVSSAGDAGSVLVLYGTAAGLAATDHRIFNQNSSGGDGSMQDSSEIGDNFGWALAAGDFNQDLSDDLAIGVPAEAVGAVAGAGAVQVVYGFTNVGLRLTGNQLWSEDNVDTGGPLEAQDFFGSALAAGDVTGEGVDDLVIGAPREDIDGLEDAGAVTLLWGQLGSGLGIVGSIILDQSDLGDGESPGVFDNFGFSLAIGDFIDANSLGARDLAIGTPQEDVFSIALGHEWAAAGSVQIIPGGFGLQPAGAQLWAQGFNGSAGASDFNVGQYYGFALAAGDFDGNAHSDLAIGAISVNGLTAPGSVGVNSGCVYSLYGQHLAPGFNGVFADGFETGSAGRWSAKTP